LPSQLKAGFERTKTSRITAVTNKSFTTDKDKEQLSWRVTRIDEREKFKKGA